VNKSIIFGIVGAVVGGIAGFLAAKVHYKKKFEDELNSIRATHNELKATKETPKEDDAKEVPEEPTSDEVVYKLSEEEEADEDYEFDEEELADARVQFAREVEEYIGTGRPYNITEEEFGTPYQGYNKVTMVINEDVDRAYDADTGEEIEDWHDIIGDQTFDTLNPEHEDDFGAIYVRSENQGTDYHVTYSRFDWV
jgi:hypothetical protein